MNSEERRQLIEMDVFPNSGLRTQDFTLGEKVIIIDPRGQKYDFMAGLFDIEDVGIITKFGWDTVYVKVLRNGYECRMRPKRFAKYIGPFAIKDVVEVQGNKGVIKSFSNETNKCLVVLESGEVYVDEKDIKLLGRKSLI